MSGAGVQNNLVGNRLTPRVTVRTVDDVDPSLDEVTEIIDTRLSESGGDNVRGDHQTLAIFAILANGATAATLRLFAFGGDGDSQGSSSSSSLGEDAWCLVEEFSVTADNLLKIFVDMPAGEYKVMVTALTGGSGERVVIKEQHSS